ncbi:hypothetical protein [Limosilactobacillus reuteri]|uniref:hypothetical protein n=1 Tax=Limosilactobacillus reuteri TaxID=1598 RepID=UPI001094799F|nr:hypothetical protein [Limosilactobacillus reuteri]TGY58443.1 hypothetical protein E5337_07710 [Limosilactobacillus reuteri]
MKHGENGHLKKLFVFTLHLCMKGIGEMLFCISNPRLIDKYSITLFFIYFEQKLFDIYSVIAGLVTLSASAVCLMM